MNDVNDKNLIPSTQGEDGALETKDSKIIALAQEIVAVVRKSESSYYALDALAVATALCRPVMGIQINGSLPE